MARSSLALGGEPNSFPTPLSRGEDFNFAFLKIEIVGIIGGGANDKPGFYVVTIKPSVAMAWDRGFIALGIAVKRMVIQYSGSGPVKDSPARTDYGQTVIALEMVEPGS
jgi:hypothetical protein